MVAFTSLFDSLISIAAIVFGALVAYWVIVFFSEKLRRLLNHALVSSKGPDPRVRTLCTMVRMIGGVALLFIAGSLILAQLRIDISGLLTGAGILGLVFTFSVQALLRDVVSGVFILTESQYRPGDVVTLNDVSGTVERVTLRTTVLRGASSTRILIPNGEIKIVRVHEKK